MPTKKNSAASTKSTPKTPTSTKPTGASLKAPKSGKLETTVRMA